MPDNLAPSCLRGSSASCWSAFRSPSAWELAASFFAFIGIELNVLPEALLQALPLRIYGIMQNETLLAIPFFTLMGLILERQAAWPRTLLDTIGQLFGPIRAAAWLWP